MVSVCLTAVATPSLPSARHAPIHTLPFLEFNCIFVFFLSGPIDSSSSFTSFFELFQGDRENKKLERSSTQLGFITNAARLHLPSSIPSIVYQPVPPLRRPPPFSYSHKHERIYGKGFGVNNNLKRNGTIRSTS